MIYSKIASYFTELWPLKNSPKFEFLPFSRKKLKISTFSSEYLLPVKEQKFFCMTSSTHIINIKRIKWKHSELWPFCYISSFSLFVKLTVFEHYIYLVGFLIQNWIFCLIGLKIYQSISKRWVSNFPTPTSRQNPRWPPK